MRLSLKQRSHAFVAFSLRDFRVKPPAGAPPVRRNIALPERVQG
jgi:hypothetical protein